MCGDTYMLKYHLTCCNSTHYNIVVLETVRHQWKMRHTSVVGSCAQNILLGAHHIVHQPKIEIHT